ncbi:hypothetical protein ACFWWA_36670 [Streptomyces goshikiensis]|uniref:hypothetical protein n=1 Tax=Streptomyces goshikiensis TaxID=1942 RepID=UPI003654BBC0
MTLTDYDDDAYLTGLEDDEPDPAHDPFLTRTVRNAPPGDIRAASPRELRVGDWLVIGSTAREITNMFSPGHDGSEKCVILRGYPPQLVKARHEIVRPYATSHCAPSRPW